MDFAARVVDNLDDTLSEIYKNDGGTLRINELQMSTLFEIQNLISITGCNCFGTSLYHLATMFQEIYKQLRSLVPETQRKRFQDAAEYHEWTWRVQPNQIFLSCTISLCEPCGKLWMGVLAVLGECLPGGGKISSQLSSFEFVLNEPNFVKGRHIGILGGLLFAVVCGLHIGNETVLLTYGSICREVLQDVFDTPTFKNLVAKLEDLSPWCYIICRYQSLKVFRFSGDGTFNHMCTEFRLACEQRGLDTLGVSLAAEPGNRQCNRQAWLAEAMNYRPWREIPRDPQPAPAVEEDEIEVIQID